MSDAIVQPMRLIDVTPDDGAFTPMLVPGTTKDGSSKAGNPAFARIDGDDLYSRGLADGQQMAIATFEAERSHLLDLIASMEALQPEPSDELAVLIGEAVEILVTQIVEGAAIDRDLLNARAKQAADLVAECDAARTMWVHPDDAELLAEAMIAVPVKTDPKADRGSVRIDCSAGWIEHGSALYLEQLRVELGLVKDSK